MTFRVGQKVKYVGPDFGSPWNQITPTPNAEYTVRACGFVMGEDAILLNEVINAPRQWAEGIHELWMNSKFFRPIVERKTDISIFKRMLIPSRQKETAQ